MVRQTLARMRCGIAAMALSSLSDWGPWLSKKDLCKSTSEERYEEKYVDW